MNRGFLISVLSIAFLATVALLSAETGSDSEPHCDDQKDGKPMAPANGASFGGPEGCFQINWGYLWTGFVKAAYDEKTANSFKTDLGYSENVPYDGDADFHIKWHYYTKADDSCPSGCKWYKQEKAIISVLYFRAYKQTPNQFNVGRPTGWDVMPPGNQHFAQAGHPVNPNYDFNTPDITSGRPEDWEKQRKGLEKNFEYNVGDPIPLKCVSDGYDPVQAEEGKK